MNQIPPPPLTVKEAAERLKISEPRIRQLIKIGVLRAVKLSVRQTRVLWQSVVEYEQAGLQDSVALSLTAGGQASGTSSDRATGRRIESLLAKS